jgi:predicted enzyme related to lactoylglutathione lyase
MGTHHRINYIEFQATDLEAVKRFYSGTFGWAFTDYGPEYVAFNDGSLDGGFARGDLEGTGSPLVIFYSDNLEDSLRLVEANGGTVVKPIYGFPGGRRFHFADPAGNELAIWSEVR